MGRGRQEEEQVHGRALGALRFPKATAMGMVPL